MAIKPLPPPVKTSDPARGWSQLLDWLALLWTFVYTPALRANAGNVPTSVTGVPGDTSLQIATDEFVATALQPQYSLAVMNALASSEGSFTIISSHTTFY